MRRHALEDGGLRGWADFEISNPRVDTLLDICNGACAALAGGALLHERAAVAPGALAASNLGERSAKL